MTHYGKVAAGLIAAWFSAVLAASALHVFTTPPGRPPLPLGLAVLVPIAAFWLWFRSSEQFRQFTLALNPRTLTIVQSWRIVGFVFLVLYTYGILPGLFALPAGLGDIVIGATAPLAALALADPKHRSSFIFWQALGILDLVLAIVLGAADSFIHPQRNSDQPRDSAASEYHSDFRRTCTADPPSDLYRSSSSLARRLGQQGLHFRPGRRRRLSTRPRHRDGRRRVRKS